MSPQDIAGTRIEAWTIGELDQAVQTAQLLKLSEGGFARDRFGNLLEQKDESRDKLDSYVIGVLDQLCRARASKACILPLIVFALAISDFGPGLAALNKAQRMIDSMSNQNYLRYVDLGRRSVRQMFHGPATAPGEFARLLSKD